MLLLRRNKQYGLAVLSYLLFSVFLLGLIGAIVAKSRMGPDNAGKAWVNGSDIAAQANLIRNKLLDCSTGEGNNGSTNHPSYPLGSSAGTTTLVSALTCPTNGQSLLSGTDGIFLPPTPTGFNAWQYTNKAACAAGITPATASATPCGVYLDLVATSSTTYTQNADALSKAATSLGTSVSILTGTTYTPNYSLRVFVTY